MGASVSAAAASAHNTPTLSFPASRAVTVGTADEHASEESSAALPAPWSDAEIRRFNVRTAMFMRRGIHEDDAEHLAETLVTRDRDMDSRRYCVECKHLQQDGGCFMAQQGCVAGVTGHYKPVRLVLQRCPNFDWLAPKTTRRSAH